MATIRRPGTASAAVLVGLTAAMIGAHLLAPDWSRRVGLDVWNYAAAEADGRLAVEERDEMNAKAEQHARRRAVADQLAARLITGDAGLAAVAADLFDLFRDDAGARTALEAYSLGAGDPRLRYARHAIHRVRRLLADDPARCEAVCARLESEYRALAAECDSAAP